MNKKIKLTISVLIITLALFFGGNIVKATSSATITAAEECYVGESITVTLNYTAAAWDLHVSSELSTSSTTDFASATDDAKNATFSKTITYKATKAGNYTIKLTGTVSDENDEASSSGKVIDTTISVKVIEKTVQKEDKTEGSTEDNTSGSNTTTKPEPKFSSVNQTVYAKDDVNVREKYNTNSNVIVTLSKGDSITRTGIGDNGWSKVTYNGKTAYVSSSFLTTTKPIVEEPEEEKEEKEEKSSDNSLKSLKVSPTGLTPNFDSETKNYELTIGSDIDDVKVDAVAADENAKVEVLGNKDLEVGENTIKIIVTAEDGTERTYKIVVTKENEEQLGLKELLIENVTLSPKFEQDVYSYKVELEDTNIKELNITATASRKNAGVEIIGNTDLKLGDNTITIIVKAEDEETVTYQITATIKEPTTETNASAVENSNNNDLKKYVVIGAAALIIIAIIVIIVSKKEEIDEEEFDLQTLADEDLPKSLRKNKKEENASKEIQLPVEKDLKEKIDELMSEDDTTDNFKPSGKGKHF